MYVPSNPGPVKVDVFCSYKTGHVVGFHRVDGALGEVSLDLYVEDSTALDDYEVGQPYTLSLERSQA